MSAAQLLLRRLLDQAGGATETGYLLVIDGEGLENLPAEMPTPKGSYGVHRITTELGLRHLLWKAKGAPLIAVMPEDVARRIQKAPDLLRRARNQRVHALSLVPKPVIRPQPKKSAPKKKAQERLAAAAEAAAKAAEAAPAACGSKGG